LDRNVNNVTEKKIEKHEHIEWCCHVVRIQMEHEEGEKADVDSKAEKSDNYVGVRDSISDAKK